MLKPQLWILILMVSFTAVNGILFTPALPEMGNAFGVSEQEIQLSITIYLLGYCLGNLIYGPLASAFGRKPVLKMSLLFSVISTVLVLFSGQVESYFLLLVFRLIQAFSAVGAMKITLTMVSDSFDEKESARALSYILISFAIAPGASIFIGGYLTEWFGWESNFYFLILYGIVFFYLATLLPETLKEENRQPLCLATSLNNYRHALHNRRCVLGGLIMGLGTSCVYLYSTAAPFIGIDHLKLNPGFYGLCNLLPSAGMLIGSLLNSELVKRLRPIYALRYGILIMLISALWMLITFLTTGVTALMLFLPMFLLYIGMAMEFPNATSTALTNVHNKSYASALLNTLNMGTAVLTVFILSLVPIASPNTLPILLTIVLILALVLYFPLKKAVISYPTDPQ